MRYAVSANMLSRAAVDPSLEAAGKTSVFFTPRNSMFALTSHRINQVRVE
jgi:hypothetical protein